MTAVRAPGRGTGQRRKGSGAGARIAVVLPGIVLAIALLVFAVTRFGELEATVKSGRAILVIAGIVAVWVVLARFVLPRFVRSAWLRSGILTVLALAIIAVLLVPYYRDTEVVEAFPEVTTPAKPSTSDTGPEGTGGAPSAPAPEPRRVSTGDLRGIDHDATGTAAVYQQPNGAFVVGLEDIDVESGPDYYVYVVEGVDRESPDDGVNLGALRGNQGTQYYDVPAGTEAGADWTVLIWCRAFGVPIANATQTAA
jgi:4-amino-4-deoxy-L-arabinose transferase-like glycosyltransferase